MMRPKLRYSLVIAAGIVLFAAVAAEGHKFVATSSVKITQADANGVSGKVTSAQKFCRANRVIVLLKHTPGANEEFATTKTNSSGTWEYDQPLPQAFQNEYKAQAARKSFVGTKGGTHHKHNCVADKTSFSAEVP
jgi:hypothetical protein